MAQYPLYQNNKIPSAVNPTKIVPNLLSASEKKAISVPASTLLSGLNHEKKITKAQKPKNYRTKMCPYGRQCKRRFTCNFAHTEQQLRKPFIKRVKPCLLYQRGLCSLGSACRDYHGNIDLKNNYKYKREICKQYLEGNCEKGELCIFIHDKPEQKCQDLQNQQEIIVPLVGENQQKQKVKSPELKNEQEQSSQQLQIQQKAKHEMFIEISKKEKEQEEEELQGGLVLKF